MKSPITNHLSRNLIWLLATSLLLIFGLTGCSNENPPASKSGQLYTCPMHPQIIRDAPGDCPICGMRLVPVRNGAASNAPARPNASATNSQPPHAAEFTCPMHPEIVSNAPGKCPICHMNLKPAETVSPPAAASSIGSDASKSQLVIDPVMTQNMNLRTARVTRGPLHSNLRTIGIVDYDETALTDVSTKFRGWIEKLYVDATGKQMHKGEPMFEIYSPELYLAQTEYLLTLSSGAPVFSPAATLESSGVLAAATPSTNTAPSSYESASAALRRNAALTKLKFWDISDDQIHELEQTRTPKRTLRVNAPRDGIVMEKMVVEGQMIEPGMKLYRLADLGTVWVIAQVYEQDLNSVKLGEEAVVSLSAQPEPKFRGRVTYIYPSVDDRTRTARVRMEFHNPGYFLKPGMYATVELDQELKSDALLVPASAVLRSGENDTVFVSASEPGHFEPRSLTIGARSDNDSYEVLTGVTEGETVVTSGQFLLDSESQLREAIQKFSADGGDSNQSAEFPVSSNVKTVQHPSESTNVVYLCPMPEHVALQYSHPGKCPLCGMALVPVTPELLAKIQPGGHIDHYTCPMPEHQDVHESKPGKCPRCSMTLIPVMKP